MSKEGGAEGVLVLVMGLPGSGKTTLSERLAKRLGDGTRLLCLDRLLADRAAWADPHYSWKSDRQAILDALRSWLNLPSVARDKEPRLPAYRKTLRVLGERLGKWVVIVDDNLYYRSMRVPWHQLAAEHSLGFSIFYLNTPLDECLRRNAMRVDSERVGDEIIRTMAKRLEPPIQSWEEWLELTEPTSSLERATAAVEAAFGRPVSGSAADREALELQRARDRETTRESRIHQVDLMMREEVGSTLRELSKEDKALYGPVLSAWKATVLQRLRNGEYDPHALDRAQIQHSINTMLHTHS